MTSKEEDLDTHLLARWRQILKEIQKGFPSPWKETAKDQFFEKTFKDAITEVNNLKHSRFYEGQSALKPYLGVPVLPQYKSSKSAVMGDHVLPHQEVIQEMIKFFEGMPNWGHPQTMCNVNPPPNTASIVAASLGGLFNPDIMEGEYSWNVAKAEIESGSMLSELMGWDPQSSGGVYTFGGTGSYLYALKLAMTKVLGKKTRFEGIREEAILLVAENGHYAKYTCADWSGLGINNHRKIAVDAQNQMDIPSLKEEMKKCQDEGKPIVMIVATAGSTDAFAIDPILEIRNLIDSYTNAKGYPKPFLYADAVIGWSWMVFKKYNFEENPLEFSSAACQIIKKNFEKIRHLDLVDAMGIDFHKTGWTPYNSSFFLVKDYPAFTSLLGRELPPYLQFSTSYNPFIFTLETSRGASGALAGWSSLKFFGYTGFKVMMGRIIEITYFFRQILDKDFNLVCVNSDNYGFVTLFRVYPRQVNAKTQYEKELNDPEFREELRANNALQKMIANKLFDMLRDEKERIPGWENPPYTSFTEGYRAPAYTPSESQGQYLIQALKAFPMSPFSNEISLLLVRNYALKARDLVIEELLKKRGNPSFNSTATDNRVKRWYGEEDEEILYAYLIKLGKEAAIFKEDVKTEVTSQEFGNVQFKLVPNQYDKFPEEDQMMLQSIPLLVHLTLSEFIKFMKKSLVETIPTDTVLFTQGEEATDVYILMEGTVCIYNQMHHEKHVLANLGRGELFGEMAIFETGKRSASARTTTACKLIRIKGNEFIELIF